jgi:hypothetical protein
VRSFLLWALVICFLILFPYAKSRLDSKELVQHRSPSQKRLIGVNALPTKLNLSPINLVLISTLDGSLHGVDRYTGQVLWSLEGAADGSLIRTYTRSSSKQQNKNTDMMEDKEKDVNIDMNSQKQDKNYSGNRHDDSQLTKLKDDVEDEEDSDREITYIVEPTNDGILYLFSPKTGLQVEIHSRKCSFIIDLYCILFCLKYFLEYYYYESLLY